jgi:glycosyltransferase involved in cell wall biosynthesis
MQWLAAGGHDCRVLGTARFDARPPASIDQHLTTLGVPLTRHPAPKAFVRSVRKPSNMAVGRPTVGFTLAGVPVTMLLTRGPLRSRADQIEADQFVFHLDEVLERLAPDVLVTYGGHFVVQEALRRARARGVTTVFSLRNFGYEDRHYFDHVDHVFTTSPYVSECYRDRIGLRSTGIESPIEWEDVEAPVETRRFVTFVNPSVQKGSMLFARLADMLGSRRPDIPILVVQSAASAGLLNDIPGLDFTKYPHIMAAPATPRPADFFALTKILLVPSAFREPFGRVAAEALINGIPPIVSDRGALPQTVRDAGRVLPLPAWLTEKTHELPSVEETEPWFDAVCDLWDDAEGYQRASDHARAVAERHFAEGVVRRRYLDYFSSLGSPVPLFP